MKRAKAEYAFVAMKDGDAMEFPGLRLQILETPGHTIESISISCSTLRRMRTDASGDFGGHGLKCIATGGECSPGFDAVYEPSVFSCMQRTNYVFPDYGIRITIVQLLANLALGARI